MRTGFSIAQGRRNTSFCTKIRKALGKKPKKGGRKLSTIKSATRREGESENLFYFLGHPRRTIAPTLSWNFSAFLPPSPPPHGASGNSLGALSTSSQTSQNSKSLQIPSRRLKGPGTNSKIRFSLGSQLPRECLTPSGTAVRQGSRLQPRLVWLAPPGSQALPAHRASPSGRRPPAWSRVGHSLRVRRHLAKGGFQDRLAARAACQPRKRLPPARGSEGRGV